MRVLAPNVLLQNRYLIVRLIGKGGMGAVYQATDQRLGNAVALKETFFTDDFLRKAFEREARLLASLRHPVLPGVSDHFIEEDGQFLVMQFIPGDDLSELLARDGAFPPDQVLNWGDMLLDALDYLHTQDPPIVHRDIKPQNLKLTARGEIILLDFGLAKGSLTQRLTNSGSIFGYSPHYAPLEQIQGVGTDPRSDLFAFAATLHHLMTGITPPDALTRATALISGQPDPLIPINELNPQVSPDIASVLFQAMSLNRDQRPASAVAMRTALRDTWCIGTSESRQFFTSHFTPNTRSQPALKPPNAVSSPTLPNARNAGNSANNARNSNIARSDDYQQRTGDIPLPERTVMSSDRTEIMDRAFKPGKFSQPLVPNYDPDEISLSPESILRDAAAYYNRGIARFDQGDIAGAIADYDRAIEINPRYAKAYTNRGTARSDQGDLAGAIADYNKAIEINPRDADAYNNRGIARFDQGYFAGAIADYSLSIELNPKDADAYNNRGIARKAIGDIVGAMADYDKAIEINPRYAKAYTNRGSARAEQGDLAGTISDYDKAIEINPRDADAYNNRGIARKAIGDLFGAINDYDAALKINPRDAAVYNNRGIAHAEQGELERAISDYNRAIDINPRDPKTYTNRGIARSGQGDLAGAIADYNEALDLDASCAEAYANRGLARLFQGREQEAQQDFNRCYRLRADLRPQIEELIERARREQEIQ